MNKALILIAALSCLFFTTHLSALESGSPVIRGDDEYVGDFVAIRDNRIHIDLSRTGYRVSPPLANDVVFLHKDMNYEPYDPEKIFPGAPVKAILLDGKIVQVIMLWMIPR